MPQSYPTTVDFQLPLEPDSLGNPQYKTVHLVIIDPVKKEDKSFTATILEPFGIVALIAVAIFLFARLAAPGTRANPFSRLLQKLADHINGTIHRD